MSGAILTFLGVCAIVAIYMSIVHRMLRSSEEPADRVRDELERRARRESSPHRTKLRLRWAE